VKEVTGADFSAKDFRTWSATVLAAVALSVSGPAAGGSKTGRNRAKTRAIKEVARYLGNTPAVCRASYIDPRVFDRFDGGLTIGGVLPELAEDTGPWPEVQGAVEEAVLDLLNGEKGSPALEKVA
jgi:DNA topoisomerase-1